MSNAGQNARGSLKSPPFFVMSAFDALPSWARAIIRDAAIDLNTETILRDIQSGRLSQEKLAAIVCRQNARIHSESFPDL